MRLLRDSVFCFLVAIILEILLKASAFVLTGMSPNRDSVLFDDASVGDMIPNINKYLNEVNHVQVLHRRIDQSKVSSNV